MSSQKYDFLANDVSAVLEAVNPHITDENRETVLGSTVMQFYRGGSTSSLVFLAVCADLLRVTIDCLFADDTL